MIQILLVAHAPMASALLAVAEHVFPELAPRMRAVDVAPQSNAHQAEASVRDALQTLLAPGRASNGGAPEVLVLADVFGATPCNAAIAAAEGLPVRVVTGVSVPMLWRVLGYANKTIDELVLSAVAGAAQGAFHASVTRRQNQGTSPASHDQEHDNHHQ
jgi:PTS system ascorbate-specific IIA component